MKPIIQFILLIFISFFSIAGFSQEWIIAIDPGHGGKDPGAIGRKLKTYEKNVTLAIAKELKYLLDKDPNFDAVLTRKGDYYISVSQRSEIARKQKANFLISIHADSSLSPQLRGASVWVLSNRRANSEMGRWLEDSEKQSELLGGAGTVLSSHNEKYLDQTVLDLQFGHSQRVGYELGRIVLKRFAKITTLSRNTPQHASLGVLRSPDIPSILVETGFLSNATEEKKLSNKQYRQQIARLIYDSLVEYRKRYYKPQPKILVAGDDKKDQKIDRTFIHKVKKGETLFQISVKYNISMNALIKLNNIKNKQVFVGQNLKIPNIVENSESKAQENKKQKLSSKENKQETKQEKAENKKTVVAKFHIVKKNQTLYSIAREYGVSPQKLLKLNPHLKNGKVLTGQKIRLRE